MGAQGIKPEILVIIPVHNCVEYTCECVKSLASRYRLAVIIIDNASTDGTAEFLTEFLKRQWAGAVRNELNLGAAGSWNYGIRFNFQQLGARYMLILNNDTLLHPDCIDKLVDHARNTEDGLITAYNMAPYLPKPTDILTAKNQLPVEITEAPDFSCFLLKSSTVEKIGFFDENFQPAYFEDNDYHRRMKLAGIRAAKTTRALYYHYQSQTKKDNPDIENEIRHTYLRNEGYYVKKWGGRVGHEQFKTPFNQGAAK